MTASSRDTYYKFDNGVTIVKDTTYWFRREPITWRILSNTDGEYYLLSSILLDTRFYYRSQEERVIDGWKICPNNYEESDIRLWLNNEFFESAFYLGNDNIQETLVDNSPETTHSPANSWCCDDTTDKVFLPSYKDYMNVGYGFENTTDSSDFRKCITSDWCRARGVYYHKKMNQYYSPYWTRSPFRHYNSIYSAADIDSAGRMAGSDVSFAGNAVRPAINLKLS